jgi:chromate reductase, NAD(P)H dehydrogenase (quinone)
MPARIRAGTRVGRPRSAQEEVMEPLKVGYLVGSLASKSLNRKLAKALVRLAPDGLELQEISFDALPMYSYDFDRNYPPEAKAFKAEIEAVDAVLFITPEYNRSIPGALKNAIDWASRPYGKNAFTDKPSAIIGASPGKIGTAVAQQHLRSILAYCNSPQLMAPEAYIQLPRDRVTDDGEIRDESMAEFLGEFMEALHDFVSSMKSIETGASVN